MAARSPARFVPEAIHIQGWAAGEAPCVSCLAVEATAPVPKYFPRPGADGGEDLKGGGRVDEAAGTAAAPVPPPRRVRTGQSTSTAPAAATAEDRVAVLQYVAMSDDARFVTDVRNMVGDPTLDVQC